MPLLEDLEPDRAFELRVRILSRGWAPPAIKDIQYQGEYLTLRDWTPEGKGFRLTCALSPHVRHRTVTGRFEVTLEGTKGEAARKLLLPFTGTLSPEAVKRLLIPPPVKKKPGPKKPGNPAVSALPAAPARSGAPRLIVDRMEQDFGRVPQGPPLKTVFTLSNKGEGDLHILDIQRTCGCVVPENLKGKTIPPGGSLPLTVSLTTANKALSLAKSLIVKTDDPALPALRLKLRAYVHVDWRLVRPSLHLHDVQRGRVYEEKVFVDSYMDHPLELREFEAQHDFIQAFFEHTDKDRRDLVRIVVDTRGRELRRGKVAGHIRFKTNSGQIPEGKLSYVLDTILDVRVTPRSLSLFRYPDRPATKGAEQVLHLENVLNREMTLKDLQLDVEGLEAEVTRGKGTVLTITLRIKPETGPCIDSGHLTLLLEGAEDNKIKVPVTLVVRKAARERE